MGFDFASSPNLGVAGLTGVVQVTPDPGTGDGGNAPGAADNCLLRSGMAFCIPPSGTMAANGAVTFGTAMANTYSMGMWTFFPAGAVYAGSVAGFYWTVMSSTTVGQVFDTRYVPGLAGSSYEIPSAPVPITLAGPGAFTGPTSTITAISFIVPGGLMGRHGGMEIEFMVTLNNTAGTKTVSGFYGTLGCAASTLTAHNNARQRGQFWNKGRPDRQASAVWIGYTGQTAAGSVSVAGVVDSRIDQVARIDLSHTTATDFIVLEAVAFNYTHG